MVNALGLESSALLKKHMHIISSPLSKATFAFSFTLKDETDGTGAIARVSRLECSISNFRFYINQLASALILPAISKSSAAIMVTPSNTSWLQLQMIGAGDILQTNSHIIKTCSSYFIRINIAVRIERARSNSAGKSMRSHSDPLIILCKQQNQPTEHFATTKLLHTFVHNNSVIVSRSTSGLTWRRNRLRGTGSSIDYEWWITLSWKRRVWSRQPLIPPSRVDARVGWHARIWCGLVDNINETLMYTIPWNISFLVLLSYHKSCINVNM